MRKYPELDDDFPRIGVGAIGADGINHEGLDTIGVELDGVFKKVFWFASGNPSVRVSQVLLYREDTCDNCFFNSGESGICNSLDNNGEISGMSSCYVCPSHAE